MAVTTRVLTIHTLNMLDAAHEGAQVTVRLTRSDIDADGVVMPVQSVTAVTNVDGIATMQLWPNALGMRDSRYSVTIRTNNGAQVLFRGRFFMPDFDATLESLLALEAVPVGSQGAFLLAAQGLVVGEATTRAAADTALQAEIDAEETARVNADASLQASVDAEVAARIQAMVTHEAAVDPHPQYLVQADFDAHEAAGDPHPQYTTVAEAAARHPLRTEIGANDGIAGLDSAGKVPASQLPSYVDDVLMYANLAAFPVGGETGVIYVAEDTGVCYRWTGSSYLKISDDDVLEFANLAAFPVSGSGATLYIAADTGLVYRWDGAAYVATGLQPIANNTVLGNVSGSTATPTALTQTQLRELVGVKAQFVEMTTPNQAIVLDADTSALHLLGPGSSGVTVNLSALNEGATLVVTSEVATSTITFSKPAANHYLQGANGATASIQMQLDQFCIYTFTNVNGKILAGKSLSNAVSFGSTFTPAIVTSLYNAGALHLPATIQRSITTNTTAGGNSRGTGAVDFQRSRGAASQVASGQDSFLFPGDRSTASQTQTVAGGYQTSVSGTYSFGYTFNGSVTGSRAFLLGGASGSAIGSNGGQIGGDGSNITSGQRAVGIGGGGNIASAQDSVYIGGYGANVNVQGAHATGAGIFGLRRQRLVHVAGELTTNVQPKALISSSQNDAVFAGNVLRSAATDATLLVSGRVLGVSGAEHKAMRFDAILVKTGTSYTVGWQSFTVIDETAALATASAEFVGSSFGWELRVTGVTATTIHWVSETEALEQVR